MNSHHFSIRMRLQAIFAVFLLQANLALAVEPVGQQAPSQTPPSDSQTTPAAPESPAPAASGTTAPNLTLAQQMQQDQQQAAAPQKPFHVELPHSHKPFAAY